MTIPHRIRALLALRGWTVAQLAQAAGLPPATVKTHLRGLTDLTGRASGRALSTRPPVEVYADALGVTVEVLTEAWVVEVEVDALAEEAAVEHRRMNPEDFEAVARFAEMAERYDRKYPETVGIQIAVDGDVAHLPFETIRRIADAIASRAPSARPRKVESNE